jgi:GT2 family glycosyltransferase
MSGDQAIAGVKSPISPAARTPSKADDKFITKRSKMRLLASRDEMARIMGIDPDAAPDAERGYIDYWGFSPGLEGWIVGGWARTGAFTSAGDCNIEAIFGDEYLALGALFVTFLRSDVAEHGLGFVMFIAGPRRNAALSSISVREMGSRFSLRLSNEARAIEEPVLLREARVCARKSINQGRARFLELIERPVFDGSDTIAALAPAVQLGIDEVIFAPGCGVVTVGWLLDPLSQVKAVRIRHEDEIATLTDRWISSERADVTHAFGTSLDLTHSRWGFTAFGRLAAEAYSGAYLEVILKDGRIGHRALPAPARNGLPAIKTILNDVVLSPDSILDVCKDVIAEPVRAINRARLSRDVAFLEGSAGICPTSPRTSIVIPLYGRLDFLTYQAALFDAAEHVNDEFIYVLDQPERKDEFFELARIAHIKTRIPFRLLVPSQNLGFAGASNLGLKMARGKYVCFLNSDVVPRSSDWMSGLVASVESRPEIGVISALMLFEDETIQHAGMDFERLPQFGNMLFPFHPRKGLSCDGERGLDVVPAVTGACMLMDRSLCQRLGGFDEDYVIGDFEDADLCMKVREHGLSCAVDHRVALYHLERQSQAKAANGWRMNLTLLNAWTFAERWDPDLLANRGTAVLKIA